MWISLGPEIVSRLDEYARGHISLQKMEDWFYPTVLDLDLHDWPEDANLVWAIKLSLAEFSNGHLSEEDLRAALRGIAKEYEDAHGTIDHTDVGELMVTDSSLSVDISV